MQGSPETQPRGTSLETPQNKQHPQIVVEKPTPKTETKQEMIQRVKQEIQEVPTKPLIIKTTDTVTHDVNSNVKLKVVICGWPKPQAYWWFKSDNKVSQPKSKTGSGAFKVNNSQRHVIERSERKKSDPAQKTTEDFSLEIKNVTPDDAGIYYITVESDQGKGLAQIRLVINKSFNKARQTSQLSEMQMPSVSERSYRTTASERSTSASERNSLTQSERSSRMGTSLGSRGGLISGSQTSLTSSVATNATRTTMNSRISSRLSTQDSLVSDISQNSAISKVSKISTVMENNSNYNYTPSVVSQGTRAESICSEQSRMSSLTDRSKATTLTQMSRHGPHGTHTVDSNKSSNRSNLNKAHGTGSRDDNLGYLEQNITDKPFFIRPLIDKRVAQKQTVSIDCEISSGKEPNLRWFINGKQIPVDARRYFFEQRGNVYKLVIPRAEKLQDNGTVHVEVTNKYGTVSCSCNLVVTEESALEPSSDSESFLNQKSEKAKADRSMAPIFTKPPNSRYKINEGERLRVTATVDGYPEPEVQWFYGDQLIGEGTNKRSHHNSASSSSQTAGGKTGGGLNLPQLDPVKGSNMKLDDGLVKFNNVRMLKNAITGQRILEIDKIRLNQSGRYICKVRNDRGHCEEETDVTVVLVPKILPPPPPSKKGSYFRKLYKCEHEVGRGTTSILKIGAKRELSKNKTMSEEERIKHNVVFKQVACEREYKRYAINERNALLNLKHNNIVAMIDNFKCYPKKHVIVLESLDIELFDHIILKNRVSETIIANLIGQLLTGVCYIHSKSWVHLDIQPANIMIKGTPTSDLPPVVKLIDFAYAKRLEPSMPIYTKFGQPEFVAPEQVAGNAVNCKTDIWSIGVCLYLILSGVSPFYGDSDRKSLENVRNCAWVFDTRTFREISKESKDLISQFLRKNPEDRIDAKTALRHEWFNVATTKSVIKTERLRYFQSRRRWSAKISGLGRPMDIRPIKDIYNAVGGNSSYTIPNKHRKIKRISDTSSSDEEFRRQTQDDKGQGLAIR